MPAWGVQNLWSAL